MRPARLCRLVLLPISAALFVAAASFASPIAFAQGPDPLKIAVIDMPRVLRSSAAVRGLSERVEALRATFRSELRAKEEEFRESDLALARERGELSPEAYAEKRRELEQRATALQREFEEKRRNLDRLFRQGMAKIQETLTKVSREISDEMGIDLLLAKATVVLVRPNLEITEVAIERLNERLSNVDLPALQN